MESENDVSVTDIYVVIFLVPGMVYGIKFWYHHTLLLYTRCPHILTPTIRMDGNPRRLIYMFSFHNKLLLLNLEVITWLCNMHEH